MGNVSAQEPVKEQIKPQSMRAPAVLLFLMGGGEKKSWWSLLYKVMVIDCSSFFSLKEKKL